MKKLKSFLVMTFMVTACLLLSSQDLWAAADEWEYEFTPYAWITDIDVTIGIEDRTLPESTIDFDDLLDIIDAAWMSYFEARKGRWGFSNEIIYMKLAADSSTTIVGDRRGIPVQLTGELEFDGTEFVSDFAVFYMPEQIPYTTLYGGLRYHNIDLDVSLAGSLTIGATTINRKPSGSAGEDWWDPFIGVRLAIPFKEKWHALAKLDTTIGINGEYTNMGTAGFSYDMSEMCSVKFAYRYAQIKYDENDFFIDQKITGPVLGVGIKF
jgi:hypothetical protein